MTNKQQLEPIEYLYRPRLRPVSFCTLPKDVKWDYVEAPAADPIIATRRGLPLSRHSYGIITLDRQLTKEEQDRYGMEIV